MVWISRFTFLPSIGGLPQGRVLLEQRSVPDSRTAGIQRRRCFENQPTDARAGSAADSLLLPVVRIIAFNPPLGPPFLGAIKRRILGDTPKPSAGTRPCTLFGFGISNFSSWCTLKLPVASRCTSSILHGNQHGRLLPAMLQQGLRRSYRASRMWSTLGRKGPRCPRSLEGIDICCYHFVIIVRLDRRVVEALASYYSVA
jgi:hypothetical protein